MPNNADNSPKPVTDRSQPYPEQMAQLASDLLAYLVSGSKAPFTTYQDLSGDWPEHTTDLRSYTRAQADAAAKRFVVTAGNSGQKNTELLPSKPTVAGAIEALKSTYTVTAGKHKNVVRYLVLHGMGVARRNFKRTAKQDANALALTLAAESGGVYFAAGVEDKDGNPRPFASTELACKAWARHSDNYGADWWVGEDKKAGRPSKAAVLSEAVTHVTQGPLA